MNTTTAPLWNDFDRCDQLACELLAVLSAERGALVTFNMAELAEATMRKEQLGRALAATRRHLRDAARAWGGAGEDEIPARLEGDDRVLWSRRRAEWLARWNEIRIACERNQRLLKHSLRNLGMLVENFKRLIGDKPTYSAKGTRVDSPFEGKVIEGRF